MEGGESGGQLEATVVVDRIAGGDGRGVLLRGRGSGHRGPPIQEVGLAGPRRGPAVRRKARSASRLIGCPAGGHLALDTSNCIPRCRGPRACGPCLVPPC